MKGSWEVFEVVLGWILDVFFRHVGIFLKWILEAFQDVKREEITEGTPIGGASEASGASPNFASSA